MKIKICGITNFNDALDAIEAGADALGFVFYEKSPRYIAPNDAKEIIKKLPPFIQSVGLFVGMYPAQIDFISKLSKIDIAQIHFQTDDNFNKSLQTKQLKVLRAKSKDDILKHQNEYILIDAFIKNYGGEGKRLNLDWFKDINCSKIILAGGLTKDNIKELKDFHFYGVDVSSGVEFSKGKKDKQKMIHFCKSVYEIS
jgi:phosphoribosylanthranilate isomerase